MLSVVIPAHNEEHELPRTLEALAKALAATDVQAEVVVVDDASSDRTAAIAAAAGARVVSASVRQIAAARNVGAAAAVGEWLLFVDADTRVSPEVVGDAVEALRAGCVGGGAEVRFEPPVPWWGRVYLFLFLLVWRPLGHAAGCFLFARRTDFEAVGGFDQRYYASEEIWLSKALRARGRWTVLRSCVHTSGRKLRMHTALGMLGTAARLLWGGPKAWQRRDGMDLWYDGRREGDPGLPPEQR